MDHGSVSFVPLLIVIALSVAVPLLLSRFKGAVVPIVVGEIVGGIIFGRSGFGLIEENSLLRVLSDLGFVFLMFLSGMEIDFTRLIQQVQEDRSTLRRFLLNPVVKGHVLFGLTLIGSLGAAFILKQRGLVEDPWVTALILSTTSLGVVMPVLKERGLSAGGFGQHLLIVSFVTDFAGIVLISAYVLLLSYGWTFEILLILILLAAFFATYRLAALFQRHLPAERIVEELSSATSQIRMRGALFLILIFVALAESLGVENILGAFLAGAIVSFLAEREGSVIRQKLEAVGYGFFIPIFFVMVGVGFDLRALLETPSTLFLVVFLLVAAYGVKMIPTLLLRLEYSWRETLAGGVLLSSRLSLIIAASAIGAKLGLISEAANSAFILVALVTCTISPILFAHIMPQRKVQERVLIVGSRKNAGLLAGELRRHGLDAFLICEDEAQESHAAEMAVPTIPAQSTLPDAFRSAGIENIRAVVAMADTDEENLRICRLAHQIHGIENVVAWVQKPALNSSFRALGARIVNPVASALLIMESMVRNPAAFPVARGVDEEQEVREIKLQNVGLANKPLATLPLPAGVAVLMIGRKGETLVPESDTMLRPNDTVTLIGIGPAVEEAVLLFARKPKC